MPAPKQAGVERASGSMRAGAGVLPSVRSVVRGDPESLSGAGVRISGWVQCRLNGRLVAEGPNLVVAAGRALIAQIVESAGATKPSHMAIGDSSLAVNDSQTGLDNEIATRVALTDTVAGNEVTYSATFTAGAPQTVEEIGIFNASTLGTMLARFLSSTISMGTGNTLDVTWVLRFGD